MTDLTRVPAADFTEADCYSLLRVLKRWVDTRNEAGYRWPTPDGKFDLPWPEMYKSRLLLWLLQGHEPLPLPPPLYMSGPQHAIEVEGDTGWYGGDDPAFGVGGWQDAGKVYWLFAAPWTLVLREVGPDGLPVSWTLTMPEHLTGTWRVERESYRQGDRDVPGWRGRRIEP